MNSQNNSIHNMLITHYPTDDVVYDFKHKQWLYDYKKIKVPDIYDDAYMSRFPIYAIRMSDGRIVYNKLIPHEHVVHIGRCQKANYICELIKPDSIFRMFDDSGVVGRTSLALTATHFSSMLRVVSRNALIMSLVNKPYIVDIFKEDRSIINVHRMHEKTVCNMYFLATKNGYDLHNCGMLFNNLLRLGLPQQTLVLASTSIRNEIMATWIRHNIRRERYHTFTQNMMAASRTHIYKFNKLIENLVDIELIVLYSELYNVASVGPCETIDLPNHLQHVATCVNNQTPSIAIAAAALRLMNFNFFYTTKYLSLDYRILYFISTDVRFNNHKTQNNPFYVDLRNCISKDGYLGIFAKESDVYYEIVLAYIRHIVRYIYRINEIMLLLRS